MDMGLRRGGHANDLGRRGQAVDDDIQQAPSGSVEHRQNHILFGASSRGDHDRSAQRRAAGPTLRHAERAETSGEGRNLGEGRAHVSVHPRYYTTNHLPAHPIKQPKVTAQDDRGCSSEVFLERSHDSPPRGGPNQHVCNVFVQYRGTDAICSRQCHCCKVCNSSLQL